MLDIVESSTQGDRKPVVRGRRLDIVADRHTVLVADDHPMFRESVKHAIEETDDFGVVAETGDGAEAVRLAGELAPEAVVLDIGLPTINGIEATRQIVERNPTSLVVALTVHDNAQHVRAMLAAGARGYLTKDVLARELVTALRQVMDGDMYLCAAALRNLVESTIADDLSTQAGSAPLLTPRETEIVRLLAKGLGNREIAEQVGVSTTTVKGHVEAILSKFGVESRAGAVGAALRAGILRIDDL